MENEQPLVKKGEKPSLDFNDNHLDEEGEVAFVGNEPYVADPNFRFRVDPLHKVNWRNISRLNLSSIKNASFDDINQAFKQNVEDIAYCDLNDE